VRVALYDPGGQLHTESICYRGGRTPISLIADASGSYRLTIEAPELDQSLVATKYLLRNQKGRATRREPHFRRTGFKEAERLRAERAPGTVLGQ